MDKRESQMYQKLVQMSSSSEFLKAVEQGDLEECGRILA